jgi:FkbM family methyltransferase
MSGAAYDQYVHTLTMAYRQFGVEVGSITSSIDESGARALSEIAKGSPGLVSETGEVDQRAHEAVIAIAAQVRRRLDLLTRPLGDQILNEPLIRSLTAEGERGARVLILIPILNQQGKDWYAQAPLENFDFVVEQSIGLLDGARMIYDFGAHHGVWSAFYSLRAAGAGFVWAFEPSILNVEISALLFLLNDISNVVNVAAAAGIRSDHGSSARAAGMLIDFVDDVHVVDIHSVCWHKADFLKMDIEGFEYDILTECPWIFDLATHMHVELHIPHLERRGRDYRDVTRLIPLDKFEVRNYQKGALTRIEADTPLEGYCSLMMKRRP